MAFWRPVTSVVDMEDLLNSAAEVASDRDRQWKRVVIATGLDRVDPQKGARRGPHYPKNRQARKLRTVCSHRGVSVFHSRQCSGPSHRSSVIRSGRLSASACDGPKGTTSSLRECISNMG